MVNKCNQQGSESLADKKKTKAKAKEKEILELVSASKKGDQIAFETLLKEMKNEMKKLLGRKKLWVDGFDEDDIYSECSIMLMKAIKSFDPVKCENFKYYANKLFKGRIVNLIQESKRQKKIILNKAGSLDVPIGEDEDGNEYCRYHLIASGDELVSDKLSRKQYTQNLKNKLYTHLTPMEKSAFELYLSNMSYEEMSQILGIESKGVDNALQRAKNKIPDAMREEIKQYEKETGLVKRKKRSKSTKVVQLKDSSKRKPKREKE